MPTKTYDPGKAHLVVGAKLVEDWESISIARDEEIWFLFSGVNGEVAGIKNLNNLAKITITCPQRSDTNSILSAIEIGGVQTTVSFLDLNEMTACAMPIALIMRLPELKYEKNPNSRQWIIAGNLPDPITIGG